MSSPASVNFGSDDQKPVMAQAVPIEGQGFPAASFPYPTNPYAAMQILAPTYNNNNNNVVQTPNTNVQQSNTMVGLGYGCFDSSLCWYDGCCTGRSLRLWIACGTLVALAILIAIIGGILAGTPKEIPPKDPSSSENEPQYEFTPGQSAYMIIACITLVFASFFCCAACWIRPDRNGMKASNTAQVSNAPTAIILNGN